MANHGLSIGHLEKSALQRPLDQANADQDMSLNRRVQAKPVFFEMPYSIKGYLVFHPGSSCIVFGLVRASRCLPQQRPRARYSAKDSQRIGRTAH